MKRWMFVFPHPDDESFACGGTLAKCTAEGQETCLICITSGCKGRSGPYQIDCREQLARHRERELASAAAILGVTRLELYRYPDGALDALDPGELSNRLAGAIVEWKPKVVVTFPPDGVTGHPDHIAVCKAVTAAVERAERELALEEYPRLYYVSIPHYYDHCPDKGPLAALPITGKVDISSYRGKKGDALRAHRSQIYSVNRAYPGVMEGDDGVIGCYEYYTLVRSEGQPVRFKPLSARIPLIEL